MTVAASILLLAVGAILRFATNLRAADIPLDTVGLILMIVGLIALVPGLIIEASQARRFHDAYARKDPRR